MLAHEGIGPGRFYCLTVGAFAGNRVTKILRRATTAQDRWEGLHKNLQIQTERPGVDVSEIQLNPLIEIRIGAAIDLPQARQPGLHTETPHQGGSIEFRNIPLWQRAGAYERHLSPQHIEELRQFVERCLAQNAPD